MLDHTLTASAQTTPTAQRFLVPSVRDIIFIFLFWSLLAGPLSSRPLADADIGWHIRSGQQILATHSLPRSDPFSSTMQGQPWFAWEWLYELVLGILYQACGLNGVVWLCALVVAVIFALLLWQLLERGTGLPLAILLMLLTEGAAMVHLYARPHIVSWLFSLIWFVVLERWERGAEGPAVSLNSLWKRCFSRRSVTSAAKADNRNRPVIAAVNRCATQNQVQDRVFLQSVKRCLDANLRHADTNLRCADTNRRHADTKLPRWIPWFFPVSMLLWVNLHSGWVLGMALLGIYTFAAFVDSVRAQKKDALAAIRGAHRARAMAAAWIASAAATLVNPFGWRLHAHIYRYLGDRYLMNHIDEFKSPDFHGWAQRCFAVILMLTAIAFASRRRSADRSKICLSHWLVALLAVYTGFYSARNLPVSSMLLVLVTGPILWESFAATAETPGAWRWVRSGVARISGFSARMGAQEMEMRGHLWPVLSVALALAICVHGGWLGSRQLIDAQFDAKRMPVGAVNFLQRENVYEPPVTEPVFSTDAWGGYLIYRMYPGRKVIMDDRHDLYGSDRVRQYLILTQAEPGWQSVLKDWQIRTALLPTDSTLADLLRELGQDWRVVYEDKVAAVFERR